MTRCGWPTSSRTCPWRSWAGCAVTGCCTSPSRPASPASTAGRPATAGRVTRHPRLASGARAWGPDVNQRGTSCVLDAGPRDAARSDQLTAGGWLAVGVAGGRFAMLGGIRILGPGGLLRGMPAVVAAGLVLTGGNGTMAAAGQRGGPGASTAAGIISTVAGGVGGPGRATKVSLSGGPGSNVSPCGLAATPGGVYVGDGSTVRKISPRDWLTTPAGSGAISGFPGDGGPAARALLEFACGVAVDSSGNLVIADGGDHAVRVAAAGAGTFYGQAMTAGDIYTVAGTGINGFSGDGRPATLADLGIPDAVAVDRAGNLVIADTGNDRVRVV